MREIHRVIGDCESATRNLVQEILSLSCEAFFLFYQKGKLKLESLSLKQRFEELKFSMVLDMTGNAASTQNFSRSMTGNAASTRRAVTTIVLAELLIDDKDISQRRRGVQNMKPFFPSHRVVIYSLSLSLSLTASLSLFVFPTTKLLIP